MESTQDIVKFLVSEYFRGLDEKNTWKTWKRISKRPTDESIFVSIRQAIDDTKLDPPDFFAASMSLRPTLEKPVLVAFLEVYHRFLAWEDSWSERALDLYQQCWDAVMDACNEELGLVDHTSRLVRAIWETVGRPYDTYEESPDDFLLRLREVIDASPNMTAHVCFSWSIYVVSSTQSGSRSIEPLLKLYAEYILRFT